jgi:hypothetical protein
MTDIKTTFKQIKKYLNEYSQELFIYVTAKKTKVTEWATALKQYNIYASYLRVSLET